MIWKNWKEKELTKNKIYKKHGYDLYDWLINYIIEPIRKLGWC